MNPARTIIDALAARRTKKAKRRQFSFHAHSGSGRVRAENPETFNGSLHPGQQQNGPTI